MNWEAELWAWWLHVFYYRYVTGLSHICAFKTVWTIVISDMITQVQNPCYVIFVTIVKRRIPGLRYRNNNCDHDEKEERLNVSLKYTTGSLTFLCLLTCFLTMYNIIISSSFSWWMKVATRGLLKYFLNWLMLLFESSLPNPLTQDFYPVCRI